MMAVMMTPRKLPSYFATEEERPASAATAAPSTPERCHGLTPAALPAPVVAKVRPVRAL